MPQHWKKLLVLFRRVLIAAIVAILLWLLLLVIFEKKFIYFPSVYPDGVYEEASHRLQPEDCWFKTEDGVQLHGWFLRVTDPIATLVMSHGNAGNISHRYPILQALQKSGFNVFMYDYRGYGRSEGSPGEDGVYKDGRAAYDFVTQRHDVDQKKIILFGTSLGGAVAVAVAQQRKTSALILEATFTSAKEMARVHYPFLPVQYMMRTEFNSIEKIRTIHVPILFIHGSIDGIVPLKLGKRLYEAANEPKEFYEIAGADHNDIFWVGGNEYIERIRSFVAQITAGINF